MKDIDSKTVVRRFVEEVENTGDVSNIKEFISEDYTEVYEGKHYHIGVKGAINHVLGVRDVFPDLHVNIEQQMSEGEWVTTVNSVTGTFEKEWYGLKPTGKPITFTGVNVDRVRGGKIVEHGGAVNMLEALQREGVIQKSE